MEIFLTVVIPRLLSLAVTVLSMAVICGRIQAAAKSRRVKTLALVSCIVITWFVIFPAPFPNPVRDFFRYLIYQPWYWVVVTLVFCALVIESRRYTRLHPIVVKTPVSTSLSKTAGFRLFDRPMDN